MEFATQGTYTAYYRVRGFSGSTDSIYAPDSFGVDPDNSVTTSQTGAFIWKKDSQSFLISTSNVGMPLEFRLGMRERQTEIDAIVLNLNSSLSDAQLDDLFAVLDGDYNRDGIVDASDYTVWRDMLGQSGVGLAADGNNDGEVNMDDYTMWQTNFGAFAGGVSLASQPAAVPESGASALALIAVFAGSGFRSRHSLVVVRVESARWFGPMSVGTIERNSSHA